MNKTKLSKAQITAIVATLTAALGGTAYNELKDDPNLTLEIKGPTDLPAGALGFLDITSNGHTVAYTVAPDKGRTLAFEDGHKIVFAIPQDEAGTYTFSVAAADADELKLIKWDVVVRGPPGPVPQPTPEPTPTPTPTNDPIPGELSKAGLKVLIIYNPLAMTTAQTSIVYSTVLDNYLNDVCGREADGTPSYRKWPWRTEPVNELQWWQDAFAKLKGPEDDSVKLIISSPNGRHKTLTIAKDATLDQVKEYIKGAL